MMMSLYSLDSDGVKVTFTGWKSPGLIEHLVTSTENPFPLFAAMEEMLRVPVPFELYIMKVLVKLFPNGVGLNFILVVDALIEAVYGT